MKNREYRALLTLALMVSLAAGSVKTTPADVYAKERTAVVTEASAKAAAQPQTKQETSTKESLEKADALGVRKEETVYAKVDGSGSVVSVTVSDQLKNVKDIKQIQDISDLQEIENVKGDEKFIKSGETLVWKGKNKDICYQGTTTKRLPVGIKVSYQLDGADISAKDLEGKSGHLVIHYAYENTTEDANAAYTPFLMVTGLMLDTDKFTNITISNGKIISDGDRDVALGMGIPKIKEALGAEGLDLSDSFDLEADVTDYDTIEGVTIATNEIFNQLGTDTFNSLDDLKESMGKLSNASDQLVSGSGELKGGLDTLLSSSGVLVDGIDQLADGSTTLKSGTGTLTDGVQTLANGSGDLVAGTKQLEEGTADLAAGAKQVADGTASAGSSVTNQLLPGVQALNAGVADMEAKLSDGQTGIPALAKGAADLNAGVDAASSGAAALQAGITNAGASASQLSAAASALSGLLGPKTVAVSETVPVDNSEEINALKAIETEENSGEIEAVIASLSAKSATVNEEIEVTTDEQAAAIAKKVTDGLSGLSTGLNGDLSAGAAALCGTLTSTDGQTVKAGAAALNNGINGAGGLAEALDAGVQQLQDGTGSLLAGTKDLSAGLTTLSKGAGSVSSGSDTLHAKIGEANQGAKRIAAGAGSLLSGAKELNSGAGTLSSGIGTLKNGSGTLTDGVQKLDDGAGELSSGMIQFHDEGIEKLVRAFDGDISTLLDKLNEMMDASRSYQNFSGISDSMDGEVRFVFVTK